MDKTDRVLKQFSRPEPQMVTPIGSDTIIPNLSGIKGNRDAMNKLTLQTVTDNGATTTKATTLGAGSKVNSSDAANVFTITPGTGFDPVVLESTQGIRWTKAGSAYLVYNNLGLAFNGVNNPAASSVLDFVSTTKGALLPRMTTTQKNAISSPATGLIVYDTTLNKLCVYTGAAWETITSV